MRVMSFLIFLVSCSSFLSGEKKELRNEWLTYRPNFENLFSEKENSSLSMECKGEPPFNRMNCKFRTVWVGRVSDMDETDQEFNRYYPKAIQNTINIILSDKEKASEARKRDTVTLTKLAQEKKEMNLSILSPEKRRYLQQKMDIANESVNCWKKKTKVLQNKCLIDSQMKKAQAERTTCSVRTHESGYFEFERKEGNKWVSVFDICNQRAVRTIAFTGKEIDWEKVPPTRQDWVFDVEVTAIPVADFMKEACKDEKEPEKSLSHYHSRGGGVASFDCNYISFDSWGD